MWVWISSAPVLDAGGRPVGVVSTMSDVTQSREAEQRLVASEAATRALADEQAALRRIATLVAGEAPPSAVFEQVTAEVARLLSAAERERPALRGRRARDGGRQLARRPG